MEKAALITGAAQGLGYATAVEFANRGIKVVAIDKLPEIHNAFRERPDILTFECDVTSIDELTSLKTSLVAAGISIAHLVNNAGIISFFPISESKPQNLERIIRINGLAPFYVLSTFLEDISSNDGSVVFISSEVVKFPGIFQAYPASKIMLEALARSVRQELSLIGGRVKIVRPGAIKTSLSTTFEMEKGPSLFSAFFKNFVDSASSFSTRYVSPQKAAKVVVKAALSRSGKFIYRINHNPVLSILSSLPYGLVRFFIARNLKRNG